MKQIDKKDTAAPNVTHKKEISGKKPSSLPLPDANVAHDGHCITTQDGEMDRPNSGEPCMDGRDSK